MHRTILNFGKSRLILIVYITLIIKLLGTILNGNYSWSILIGVLRKPKLALVNVNVNKINIIKAVINSKVPIQLPRSQLLLIFFNRSCLSDTNCFT